MRCPGTRPEWMIDCEFCGFTFDDMLGRYGCPNCLAERLRPPPGCQEKTSADKPPTDKDATP
jgi:hypothetical protein